MKVKQITLGSSTLALAVLLTACSSSSNSGVQKPTHFGHGHHDNHGANNHGNHGNHSATNHGNHNTTNPGNHGANNSGRTIIHNLKDSAIGRDEYGNFGGRISFGNFVPEITSYTLSIDGKKAQAHDIDISKYPKGHSTLNIKETVTGEDRGQSGSIITDSAVYLFKQDYSVAIGIQRKNQTKVLNGGQQTETFDYQNYLYSVKNIKNITEKLPTTGKFTYLGSGKIGSQSGDQEEVNFNYNIDFDAKIGSGRLGYITLLEGNIDKNHVIDGEATAAGSFGGHYRVGIFGPDADEITGAVQLSIGEVVGVFGGTKQAK